MPNILVVEENKMGDDVIIGDVHGNKKQLDKVLESLGENDRLVIVGDLVDRGADSLGVIKRIIEINARQVEQKKQPIPKILVVMGNHEKQFLDIADAIIDSNPLGLPNDRFIPEGLEEECEWIKKLERPDMIRARDFISKLPYIIHVNSKDDAYNVVHADLPFAGQELVKRIGTKNLSLSPAEKNHAMWSRDPKPGEEKLKKKGTHKTEGDYPHPTYCGHNIGGGYRTKTRHIDLDNKSHNIECTLAVRHKAKECLLIGDKSRADEPLTENGATTNSLMQQLEEVLQQSHEKSKEEYNHAKMNAIIMMELSELLKNNGVSDYYRIAPSEDNKKITMSSLKENFVKEIFKGIFKERGKEEKEKLNSHLKVISDKHREIRQKGSPEIFEYKNGAIVVDVHAFYAVSKALRAESHLQKEAKVNLGKASNNRK